MAFRSHSIANAEGPVAADVSGPFESPIRRETAKLAFEQAGVATDQRRIKTSSYPFKNRQSDVFRSAWNLDIHNRTENRK
ncbi:hypothetical protein [Bradyrhizobium liaoningense]